MFTTQSRARKIAACAAVTMVALTPLAVGGSGASAARGAPTVLLPNIVVPEGDSGTAAFIVNIALSEPNPFDHAVGLQVVDYTTVEVPDHPGTTYGTATPGSDYVAFNSFYLTYQPGQQVARFTVQLKGDSVVEPTEQIDVRFDDTEFNVVDNDIDLMLSNDDGTPKGSKPLLLPPNQTIPEADTGCYAYHVSVPISRPATLRSTIDAYDYNGYWPPSPTLAMAGSDYVSFATKVLTYATGKRVATLPVTICGDTTVEQAEEVDVRFGGGNGKLAVVDNDIDLFQSNDD